MSVQTRNTALQNEVVRLYFTFERDGRLANPASQPLVEIIDTDGVTVLDSMSAQLESTGIFYADWYVPANLPLGNYYDRWTYQWVNTTGVSENVLIFTVHSLDSYINFISTDITHSISERAIQLMRDLSNEFIYEAMHIPVYWEQAMRIQQDHQEKRIEKYYYFTLDNDWYDVSAEAVYFNNGQRFTVWQDLVPYFSSSSSSSESQGDSSTSSDSSISSSSSSSSSSSFDSSSSSSLSSESAGNESSSSSSELPTTTTTTTDWSYRPTLTTVGSGNPEASGTLVKISGDGPDTLPFVGVEAKQSRFSTIYDLAYQNWNQDWRPKIRLNNRLVDDGWTVDYDGRIFFDGLMTPEDSVNAMYKFAYFSDEEILSFLNFGLQMMNSTPPASIYYPNLQTMPPEWTAPVLLYAAILALKRLIFGLNFQEKRVIFTSPEYPDGAKDAIQNFKDLYAEYSTVWAEIKKDAKTRKLPGMALYVTPEYTLPGGRSRWFRYLYKSGSGG